MHLYSHKGTIGGYQTTCWAKILSIPMARAIFKKGGDFIFSSTASFRRYGIYAWFGYPLPMPQRLHEIASAGFDSVMLWWGDDFSTKDGPKDTHPDLARREGLLVENIHAPFQNAGLLWKDSLDGEDLFQCYTAGLIDCRRHSIPVLVLHLTNGTTPPALTAVGLERIDRLLGLAEQLEVKIALENVKAPGPVEQLLDRCDSPYLGLCYDTGHDFVYQPSPYQLLERYASRLVALHLHDNDGAFDRHDLLGRGKLDWSRIRRCIDSSSYTGGITGEFKRNTQTTASMAPRDYLLAALQSLKEQFPPVQNR